METEVSSRDSKEKNQIVLSAVKQQLASFTAEKLLEFENRIREQFEKRNEEVPITITEGIMHVFKEFERVCDKYINMFELYCEQNILLPRYKDSKVSPFDSVCDEERELDLKLEKRKRELLECYRKRNIVQIQQMLVQSDFGVALSRLGAIAAEFPISRLQEDVYSLRRSEVVCEEARKLRSELQAVVDQSPLEWNPKQNEMNIEMMQGVMHCFDQAGLL